MADAAAKMGPPSNPGWKFGYVPSPGEWNNTFAGKADYPVPINQGGTGGQTAAAGNYALAQRAEIITPTAQLAPLTFYSLRTDLTATTLSLPPANTCKSGDWLYLFDSGANASVNNVTINANGTDTIISGQSSVSSLLLQTNGFQLVMVTDGVSAWRAGVAGGGSGGNASPPVPKQVDGPTYTLQLSDAGQYLQFTSDDPVTITVPANTHVSYILGSVIIMEQLGLGKLSFATDPGVIVNGRYNRTSGGQYAVLQLKNGSNASPDTWTLLGDVS